jgi:hypothetical protein
LSSTPQPAKDKRHATGKHGESKKDRPHKVHITNESIRVEADFSPSVINKYDAANKETAAREKKKNRLEKLALFAGFGVLAIYIFQFNAMRESNRINRDALDAVQRPFVTFSPNIGMYPIIQNGKITEMQPEVTVTNSGATPTKNLTTKTNLYFSPNPIPTNYDFHDIGAAPDNSVLGPKDTLANDTDPFDVSQFEAVRDGRGHLYIYGWAKYSDQLKGTPDHITKFCYEMSVSYLGDLATILGSGKRIGRFTVCRQGNNCTDGECTK